MEISALYSNITPESRAALAAAINEQARSGDSIDVMVSIKGGDSQVRTMQARAKKRRISDSEWTWDGVMVDVSDLIKAQQQAAAADFAKSDFLASMSHEIRTPLNGILGFAQLLVHTVQDPAQKADARIIIETAEMLTVILNDVLDYSKIEAGGLTLEHHPFDVSGLLDSCMTLFKPAAEKRGVQFTVRNECPPALRLVGDPTRLRQIITNLLSNAVKFTEEGSVDLRVTAESTTAEQVSLAVTVTDTGRGMSAEQQERLFQRFDQVDRAIYRQYGGSGLGLAITKRLLRAMGGDISVTSAPGQGSSFRFGLTLPVANTPVGDTPTPDQRSTEPLDILVVDDVAINRELLRRILGRDGHRVTEAASGEQAIAAASQIRFDLILMDIEMPGMDGLEACRKLRSGDGPNRATYVVALTGYAFDADVQKAMDAGMDAHLAKPIMMQALRAQIEKYRASRLT
jgi:signal transduction histidine kinase/ActR/RegA family two-component response regulator